MGKICKRLELRFKVIVQITKLVEEGKIVANEIKEMPLEALPEAHDIVSKKKGKGKVVCYIDNKK